MGGGFFGGEVLKYFFHYEQNYHSAVLTEYTFFLLKICTNSRVTLTEYSGNRSILRRGTMDYCSHWGGGPSFKYPFSGHQKM